MKMKSNSFVDGGRLPSEFAFARISDDDLQARIALSSNRNPHLTWSDVPNGTRSFVLICHDPDVPSSGSDVNKEGREVLASLPRVDFYHWLLMDIDSAKRDIEAGSHSETVTPHGKSGPVTLDGCRHGINDYTKWFESDTKMSGIYYGYDGPCPPWNDTLLHHYVFTIYALDVKRLDVRGSLDGDNVRVAMKGHVIAQSSITCTYTLNPHLRS